MGGIHAKRVRLNFASGRVLDLGLRKTMAAHFSMGEKRELATDRYEERARLLARRQWRDPDFVLRVLIRKRSGACEQIRRLSRQRGAERSESREECRQKLCGSHVKVHFKFGAWAALDGALKPVYFRTVVAAGRCRIFGRMSKRRFQALACVREARATHFQ